MIKKFFKWFMSLFVSSGTKSTVVTLGKGNVTNVNQSVIKRPECVGAIYGKPFPDPQIMKKHFAEKQRETLKTSPSTNSKPLSSSSLRSHLDERKNSKVDDDDSHMYNAVIQSSYSTYSSGDDGGSYSSGSCDSSSSSSSCD